MKIAKPILLVSTPVGVVLGLYEGYRLAGGLVVLMAAMLALVSIAAATVISPSAANSARNLSVSRQIELPGDSKAVLYPGKALTESIGAGWHQHLAFDAQRRQQLFELRQRVALDKQRD